MSCAIDIIRRMNKLNTEEFRMILERAINGSNNDIDRLLKMYEPLIDRSSYLKGNFDEDLRQYIMLHIIQNISKFKI